MCYVASLKELDITNDCHVSLAEKVLSNITILSSLKLRYGGSTVNSLQLKKGPECSLRINGCGSLSTNMLERLCLLPSLQCVELESLPNITTLRAMSCATCLESLELRFCENLQELPEDLYKFQALRLLEIWVCPKINLLGLNPDKGQESLLKSLEEFVIMDSCNELTRLPVEMLDPCTSLRNLRVRNCPNLVSFPLDLRRTPSLQMLWLCDCPKLITEMPKGFGFLSSLREVWLGPYSDYSVIEFDWSGLASSSTLRKLELSGNYLDTESLPHQLQYLTTITSLWLRDFGAIKFLPDWLGNLVSLEKLWLQSCRKLQYLPSMDAMRQLTKLRYLQIANCPLLSQRCTPQSGTNSEWPKISHIPELRIG